MGTTTSPPKWIKPQLTRLVDEAPAGSDWVHEIKYDGYRMHARIDGGKIQLLTRTGLDWSHRYRRTIDALGALRVKSAYVDGELCALNSDGVPVFSRLQAAMDEGRTDQLVFFEFDLLYLNGESTAQLPLTRRKGKLQRLFNKELGGVRYSEHVTGDGPRFRAQACKLWLRRMHLARRALALADGTVKTVTEIANDHGFGELGRFAVSYRRLYGEAPSVTLRRPPDSRGSIEIGRANRLISDSA